MENLIPVFNTDSDFVLGIYRDFKFLVPNRRCPEFFDFNQTLYSRILIYYYSDWSWLDSVYFSLISISTIGIGDLVPRNTPPDSAAIHRMNESECLARVIEKLISSIDSPRADLVKNCQHYFSMLIYASSH